MPRIPPTLLRHARRINSLLPPLLPVCRDLRSSQNELRWLGEHAAEVASRSGRKHETLLNQYVNRRAKGEPLQYILGTEFFGDLEIKCRPGVLIPRQETAASVSHLAALLSKTWKQSPASKPISVLDLCTGTGCIPLLFQHELSKQNPGEDTISQIVGVDVSSKALSLADENKSVQLRGLRSSPNTNQKALSLLYNTHFLQADVLASSGPSSVTRKLQRIQTDSLSTPSYEIIISNPPYISSSAFRRTTAASVRKFEPKLALVPPSQTPTLPAGGSANNSALDDGDIFYPRVLEIAAECGAKVVLVEVADVEQACRVAAMADGWHVEIWRDDPAAGGESGEEFVGVGGVGGRQVRVWGTGNGRSVLFTKEDWIRG